MKQPGVMLLARLYCAAAAVLLIGVGLSAWVAADNSTAGVMTFGVGLFVAFGLLAKPTRLLAIVIFCGCFAMFAFVAEFAQLLWHDEPPGSAAFTRWIVEAITAGLSWKLSRPLFARVSSQD